VSQPTFQYQALASTPNLDPGVSPTPEPFVFFVEPSRRPPRTKQNFSWLTEPRAIFPPEDPVNPFAGQMLGLIPQDPGADKRTRSHEQIVAEIMNSLLGRGEIVREGAQSWRLFGSGAVTITENRAPAATDDVDSGHMPGMIWIDQAAERVYVCVLATAGAAVWVQVSN
jgi:hypothetical protein